MLADRCITKTYFIGNCPFYFSCALFNFSIFIHILFSYFDGDESVFKKIKFTSKEVCFVDNVKLCGTFKVTSPRKACITLRVPVSVAF